MKEIDCLRIRETDWIPGTRMSLSSSLINCLSLHPRLETCNWIVKGPESFLVCFLGFRTRERKSSKRPTKFFHFVHGILICPKRVVKGSPCIDWILSWVLNHAWISRDLFSSQFIRISDAKWTSLIPTHGTDSFCLSFLLFCYLFLYPSFPFWTLFTKWWFFPLGHAMSCFLLCQLHFWTQSLVITWPELAYLDIVMGYHVTDSSRRRGRNQSRLTWRMRSIKVILDHDSRRL